MFDLICKLIILLQILTGMFLLLRLVAFKLRDKPNDFYWDHLPSDLPPFAVAALLSEKKIFSPAFAAEIASFIRLGLVNYNYVNNKLILKLVKKPDDSYDLWEYQKKIFKYFILDLVDVNGEICYDDLPSGIGFNVIGVTLTLYKELIANNIYVKDSKKSIKDKCILSLIIFIAFWVYCCVDSLKIIFSLNIFLVLITFIVLIKLSKNDLYSTLTPSGKKAYKDWNSFKYFLMNYGRFNDRGIRDLILWDKFLVYACALDLSDRLEAEVDKSMTSKLLLSVKKSLFRLGIDD